MSEKELTATIRTLQKEAEKAQEELAKCKALGETGHNAYLKEKTLTSKLMNEVAQLNRKVNTAEQKAVLWANQYFEFMQKAIDQSATQMTTPPQPAPQGGGIKG